MNTSKNEVLAAQAKAEKLKIYKARLKSGDGWYFFCARNQYQAKKLASAMTVLADDAVVMRPTQADIEKTDDGFIVNDVAARQSIVKEVVVDLIVHKDVVLQPAQPIISRTAVVQKMLDSVKPKEPKLSISGMAEKLLLAGKTNAQTWA